MTQLDECQCSDCLAWDKDMAEEQRAQAIEDRVDEILADPIRFRDAVAKVEELKEDEFADALREMLRIENGAPVMTFLFKALRGIVLQELESEAERMSD